jgi:hypothetical protein
METKEFDFAEAIVREMIRIADGKLTIEECRKLAQPLAERIERSQCYQASEQEYAQILAEFALRRKERKKCIK